jgi:hypothetical protein
LRTKLTLIKDGLAFTHTNIVVDQPYDNNDDIVSKLEMIRDVNSQVVSIVPDGELMRIKSIHKKLTGAWSQDDVWGMITVEPFENERRWICSTVVPFDNDTNNPLYPLTGLFCSLTFTAPDTAVMECYFDSTKIDLSNGVKVTGKIKENRKVIGEGDKTTAPNDTAKTDDNGTNKTLATI